MPDGPAVFSKPAPKAFPEADVARHIVDIFVSVLLLAGSAYLWFVADSFPRFARYEGIDSDFWPKALMVLIGILALVLVWQNVNNLRLFMVQQANSGRAGAGDSDVNWGKLLFAAALTILYVVVLRYLGFFVSTFVFVAIAQNIVPYENRLAKIIFPFAFTALISLVFLEVMSIPLPRGVGIFYQFSLLFY